MKKETVGNAIPVWNFVCCNQC